MNSTRINLAKMWQNISRYRYGMAAQYYATNMREQAIKMQIAAADAHHMMTFYLTRLQNGERC